MNELLTVMSTDMGVHRFQNETEESFTYRLCYSALGQWCLHASQNSSGGIIGTTKHNQTIVLNDLMMRFSELFPSISDKFIDTNNQQTSFPVFIRNIYEETGYLLTNNDNHNRLANYGRSIQMGEETLFFGLPHSCYTVNGLGVYASPTTYKVLAKEFLIRDDLTSEEYFHSRFDSIDFYDRDIDLTELEFFNPKSNNVPSQSWEKSIMTDCTIARKTELGPFYRVMQMSDDSLQFADEPIESQTDCFTSYEYRRLYFALKSHYGKPLKATITNYGKIYSKIRIGGYLPNREYYFMLLLSWPENSAFNKVNFIVRNNLLNEATAVLSNIGIEIVKRNINA
ncbi:MAG: hypothetical protein LBT29_06205 [Flavobacteriaceae bacterium]|jgi:hypothetical protein|nr:hypothetical protein [Flavobacteriaceae bacterium]